MFEKLVVVTRKTRLQELIARFNTRSQAKFYIEHAGGDFADYDEEDQSYEQALKTIKREVQSDLKLQYLDRSFLSAYVFAPTDLIVVVGRDGLVANTAKYVGHQPILGVNPDPKRIDGILVPLRIRDLNSCIAAAVQGNAQIKHVTLAQAELNDGQKLLAFNDFFIGARSHVSARYKLEFAERSERQSSSGIIISTGAGSTGWLSSVFNMMDAVEQLSGCSAPNCGEPNKKKPAPKMRWDTSELMFVVREPFVSKHSQAEIVAGRISRENNLVVESAMTTEGAIFSDGIESDFIPFNAGAIAHIGIAPQRANLVTGATKSA